MLGSALVFSGTIDTFRVGENHCTAIADKSADGYAAMCCSIQGERSRSGYCQYELNARPAAFRHHLKADSPGEHSAAPLDKLTFKQAFANGFIQGIMPADVLGK